MAKYDDLIPEINTIMPGVARPIVRPLIKRVVDRFCDQSRIWRKTLPAIALTAEDIVPGGQEVNVDVARHCRAALMLAEAKLLDVMAVSLNDTPLLPDSYARVARQGVVLACAVPASLTVTVALAPADDAQEIPDFLPEHWGEVLAYGVAHRLAIQPNQAWSDHSAASYYDEQFRHGINRALFESNNQRQGNRTVTHNFFGG